MLKVLKNLKESWLSVIIIILLLIVQAACDLTLPDYTSKIVNVGIQNGGIEEVAPEMIRKSIFQAVTDEDCNERECDTCEKTGNAITKADVEARVRIMEIEIKEYFNKYRDSVQSMLYSFRTGLYSIEYAQICDAYQRLYLFATNSLERRVKGIKEHDTLDLNSKELVEKEIREIQGFLLKRVAGIERGMECMGLTMIRPSVGDEYNCNEHVADNAEDDGDMSADIKLCSCPGVKSDNHVLCKANVVVAEKEG